MEYISKQKLRAFAKRLKFSEIDTNGHRRNVPITLKQAKNAVKRFVSLDREAKYLKPSFVDTRIKVFEIRLKEKTPLERWTKVRDFLIDRLKSQVLHAYITAKVAQDNKVEPIMVLISLLDSGSSLNWFAKAVAFFNLTDNIKLPYGTTVNLAPGRFPQYGLVPGEMMLQAKTKKGKIMERLIPRNAENEALAFGQDLKGRFSVTYSILTEQDSKPHIIKHDEFFDKFNKKHPELVKTYHLNSNTIPGEILAKSLEKNAQKNFLCEFTGNRITKWKWERGVFTNLDASKIAKEYFPAIQEEIESISPKTNLIWQPDNYLLDEDSLKYELADLYLQRLTLYEREKLLIGYIVGYIKDLSIFNLKTFRDLLAQWELDGENGKIVWLLERLNSHRNEHGKDPKERDKWLEYVRISNLIQKYKKSMIAYRMYRFSTRHNDTVDTIRQN
jgi:hypothetical protein